MTPGSEQRKPRNSSKANLVISAVFHGLLAVAVIYFAAQSKAGKELLKKIGVTMVKEKPKEKPKEPEKPKEEAPKVETKVATTPKVETPKPVATLPPATTVAPAAAPPAATPASFNFEGGKTVQTITDKNELYKARLESAFRSKWTRPEDIDDHALVAEYEISIDRKGAIADAVMTRGSGNTKWDDSVKQAVSSVKGVSAAPPTNFPSKVVVRFDVVATEPVMQ